MFIYNIFIFFNTKRTVRVSAYMKTNLLHHETRITVPEGERIERTRK